MWLGCLSASAQTDGYDPTNPPNPSVPEVDTTKYYNLYVGSVPAGLGSFNNAGGKYKANDDVYLYAYEHDACKFLKWVDKDGNVLSTNRSFYYTMPASDAWVYAEYLYDPSNPANPEVSDKVKMHTLYIDCKPSVGGSFSPNGSVAMKEGDNNTVRAYPNNGFKFVRWEDAAGNVLSTSRNYLVTMGTEDIRLYGVFEYSPASPSNPGANSWDSFSGQVIVDDFEPGYLSSAIWNVIGNSSSDQVTQIIVAGKISDYDFSIANDFSNCTLVDFSRTKGATTIPWYCYSGNGQLTHIILPSSIETISNYAFNSCTALTEIECYSVTPPSVGYNAFAGLPEGVVVRVPVHSIEMYEQADGWKNFQILPLMENVRTLEVCLPGECEDGRYKNMSLELVNVKSGQQYKYVVSDRLNYMFSNLPKNTIYNAYLKNLSGAVLAQIDSVAVAEKDTSVVFGYIKTLQNVTLQVKTPSGENITSKVTPRWFDFNGNYIAAGETIQGQVEGTSVKCSVTLPASYAMLYVLPSDTVYQVLSSGNTIECNLVAIPTLELKGKVKDVTTSELLADAVVTVNQTLNGKYSKTLTTKTDKQGCFSMTVSAVPSEIVVSSTEYVSQSITLSDESLGQTVVDLQDIALKSITGARISTSFTYRESVEQGQSAEATPWFSDNNVAFTIFNKTKQCGISQFSVQDPYIVLLEEVAEGDVIQITAASKNNSFMPVVCEATVDATNNLKAEFEIVELGGLKATYSNSDNRNVVAMLYDSNGVLVSKNDYVSGAISVDGLADGAYTLVSMGKSDFFNTFGNISGFTESGLSENKDYVKNSLNVVSGVVSVVDNSSIPFFDESQLYYTGDNTSYASNKSSIVAGNYLTMQAKVDFKEAFRSHVSDVELVFDLPENNAFVENSLMIGSSLAVYQHDGNTLKVQLANTGENRVRFCVIPTASGTFTPNAYVRFKYNNTTVVQPIGNASYEVKDMTINVPSLVAKTSFAVNGTARSRAKVEIYDGNMLIGQTTALANGFWNATCELVSPYNLSDHDISAKITSTDGLTFTTETKTCKYNRYAIDVKDVNMSFYNGWLRKTVEVTWDFEHNKTSASSYMFYTGTDITFVANLTNNDTTIVSGVNIYVFTDKNETRELSASYNAKTDRWVATSRFESNNLPINVSVAVYAEDNTLIDRLEFDVLAERIANRQEEMKELSDSIAGLKQDAVDIESKKDEIDQTLASIYAQIEACDTQDGMEQLLASYFKQAEIDDSGLNFDIELPETIDQAYADEFKKKFEELTAGSSETTNSEMDDVLTEADETLDDSKDKFDYDASLNSIQDESVEVETENGKALLFHKTMADYGSLPEAVTDTVVLAMTDSTKVYAFLVGNDQVIVADSMKQEVWVIEYTQAAAEVSAALRRARIFSDFVSAMNEARKKIELLGNSVLSFVKEAVGEQNDILNETKALKELLEKNKHSLVKANNRNMLEIAEIEKQLKALTSKDVVTLDEYFSIEQKSEMIDKLKAEKFKRLKLIKQNKKYISELGEKLSKASAKIVAVSAVLGELHDYYEIVKNFVTCGSYVGYAIADYQRWHSLIDKILPCEADKAKATALYNLCRNNWDELAWRKGYYPAVGITGITSVVSVYMKVNKAARLVAKMLVSVVSDFMNNTAEAMFNTAKNTSLSWYPKRYAEYRKLRCKKGSDPDDPNEPQKPIDPKNPGNLKPVPPLDPIEPIHDPSGYVYEGVPSNRLEGVMASCYYKEIIEDMYGDLHEEIVLWDAEEYAQKNPLFTDENGMYQWDVPQGLWQVKFEKEGYQTTYSDWLPVPPPQMDVNVGMTQVSMPEVKTAKAYEDGVEVTFSKYMKPETLTTDNISIKLISNSTEQILNDVTIDYVDMESSSENSGANYVSKIALKTASDLGMADNVYLIVNKAVESYAGVKMAEDYNQEIDVEKKVREIVVDETVNIGSGMNVQIQVGANPSDASKGKTLAVKSASAMIASVDGDVDEAGYTHILLDDNGQALITVNGDMLGSTVLDFYVLDTEVEAQSKVSVVDPVKLAQVKDAIASRVDGASLYKGQKVELTCESDGATIYYTLDGSCPCDEATRILYDGNGIVIDGTTTLKVMAVGANGSESDIREYKYSVKQASAPINLVSGWNWASHNLDDDLVSDVFKKDVISRVLSQAHEMFNDPTIGFVGNLESIPASSSVKVNVKEGQSSEIALSGAQFNPERTITLYAGWNWLGYPIDQVMSVSEALANIEVEDGDYITSHGVGYAEFSNGEWVGELQTMEPGKGYLYKSASSKSFVYNNSIVSKAKALYAKRLAVDVAPWSVDVHKYPNMMCVTAELFNSEAVVDGDNYYLGAFVGDECRGVAKYINGKYFLSVYGDKKATVNFVAVDKETGESYTVDETVDFNADVLGSVSAPYPIYIVTPTGINGITADAPSVKGIYNMMGQKVKSASCGGVYVIDGRKRVVTKRNEHEYMK